MLRGLWKDISGLDAEIHIRTDANNLVSTASTTHSPEQQETIHMIQMLRKEACSGAIADLSHVRTDRGSVLSFAGFLPATWLSQVLMGLYSPWSKLLQETMGTNAG